MNENKFSGLSLTVIALLLVAIVGTGVYAYYASGAAGTATVVTSKYVVMVNNANSVGNQTFEIDLNSADENSTSATIAPGEYVAVPIEIDTTGSDVNVTYSVAAAYAEGSETITNLRLCKSVPNPDGTCGTNDANAISFTGTTNVSLYATQPITKGNKANPVIYLTWAYGDETSVTDDNADQNKEVTVVFTVDAEQVLADVNNQIRNEQVNG